jgi:ADP-ribosyl-[dinitrogen reductase] hydrolase
MNQIKDRAIGALTGLAVGDALGTTVEFKTRDSYEPLTDMVGGGVFKLSPGQWTDDTSMALCLAESLIKNQGLNPTHLMVLFDRWYRRGYLSSNGKCFDIGRSTVNAINKFETTKDPIAGDTHFTASGNGSIMRLSPVAIFAHNDINLAIETANNQSLCTHGSLECLEACRILAWTLVQLINGMTKEVLFQNAFTGLVEKLSIKSPKLQAILNYNFINKTRDQISSSGYVVDTLEAALWSTYQTNSFKDAVLLAANLGDDSDTVAAVTGQIAGALYGHSNIPEKWWNLITLNDQIYSLAEQLFEIKTP